MQKCLETPYSTGSSGSRLSISYCECNELCIQVFFDLATVCTNIKWASATSSTICNNCIILFTATFIKETAFLINYYPSFLKSNRYCLLRLQVTSHSAPSFLCILTVHTQHASSMSNPPSYI